jgi:hypothetical protein
LYHVEVFATAQDLGSNYVIDLHRKRVIEDVTATVGLTPELRLLGFASATLKFFAFREDFFPQMNVDLTTASNQIGARVPGVNAVSKISSSLEAVNMQACRTLGAKRA